jgi:uncharacterized membrane protein
MPGEDLRVTRALRESLADRGVGRAEGFRWRGGEISRLEGFSDAVFAFAVTLLVVSLEVPHTYRELTVAMRGFVPFGICFVALVAIWREHYVFFRRYGLQDSGTIWLNAALLFVVLFYVYPLKFLFTLVVSEVAGYPVGSLHGAAAEAAIAPSEMASLFVIYGCGIVAIYSLLALLYVHALGRRAALELTRLEIFDTRASIVSHLLAAGVGVVSIVIALTVPTRLVGLAGYAYFLFAPVMSTSGVIAGRRRRKLEASAP